MMTKQSVTSQIIWVVWTKPPNPWKWLTENLGLDIEHRLRTTNLCMVYDDTATLSGMRGEGEGVRGEDSFQLNGIELR